MQARDRVGQILGNYRLMRLLGRGGYAEVYLAENIHLGVQTAIKILKLRDLDSLEREKFRSEAKYMTTLENPRIIKVLDYGIEMSQRGSGNDGSTPYLVMEYAPLGTLRHLYLPNTAMPLAKIVSYTKQIAEALQYAHDKNIIHQDVKPENMLVRKPDDVALSDFGIAVAGLNTENLQLQKEEILHKMARGEQITIPGTAPYLAPERIQGHTQRASDQYSLAVVVYEWLCGSRPFEGSDLEICQKHSNELPPPLSQKFPYITREVERVVMKALAKQPGDRYKSVREFALALESAVQASSQPTAPKVAPPPMPSTPPYNPVILSATPWNSFPPQSAPSIVAPPPSPIPRMISSIPPIVAPPPSPIPRISSIPPYVPPTPPPDFSFSAQTVQNVLPGGGVKAPPKEGFSGFMEELSEVINEPLTKTRDFFVSDQYFLKTQRTRQFRLLGTPLNILSALVVLVSGPFPSSLIPAALGAVISVWMLWRCTVSVKKPIAIAFGAGVALWWGFVAASVAAHSNDSVVAAVSFLIAFAVSLGIHIWYVDNRLKN